MIKTGRWFVSVKTGNGPNSHIGDFETEADAKNWILTKSRYWASKPGRTQVIPEVPLPRRNERGRQLRRVALLA